MMKLSGVLLQVIVSNGSRLKICGRNCIFIRKMKESVSDKKYLWLVFALKQIFEPKRDEVTETKLRGLVRHRTILTEGPPLVSEVSANFSG
jgi:hypothetical protein